MSHPRQNFSASIAVGGLRILRGKTFAKWNNFAYYNFSITSMVIDRSRESKGRKNNNNNKNNKKKVSTAVSIESEELIRKELCHKNNRYFMGTGRGSSRPGVTSGFLTLLTFNIEQK